MLATATLLASMAIPAGAAQADPAPCPASRDLMTLAELEALVEAAGGQTGAELTAFFGFVDENGDGLACFKTLPEATPYPTPPLQGMDNRT
jgi:hypothetical protein